MTFTATDRGSGLRFAGGDQMYIEIRDGEEVKRRFNLREGTKREEAEETIERMWLSDVNGYSYSLLDDRGREIATLES